MLMFALADDSTFQLMNALLKYFNNLTVLKECIDLVIYSKLYIGYNVVISDRISNRKQQIVGEFLGMHLKFTYYSFQNFSKSFPIIL